MANLSVFSSLHSVNLPLPGNDPPTYAERQPVVIHLTVTGRCFARCQGCINSSVTCNEQRGLADFLPGLETLPSRDTRAVLHLLEKEGAREAMICLYGGEPLMAIAGIRQLIYLLDSHDKRLSYMLYTNGELLDRLAAEHADLVSRINLFSVSIDGGLQQHNAIRAGTDLRRIRRGLQRINTLRKGKVLMWSTLREGQSLADCFSEFTDLYDHGQVDLFFWHWVEIAEPYANFSHYAAEYEKDLRAIMVAFVGRLRSGQLLPIIHLVELILFFITGKKRHSSACGVELAANYDIIGGKIHACADLPMEQAIGEISPEGEVSFRAHDLSYLIAYKEELGCRECGVHGYCGGRCPVQAQIGTPERLRQYCQLMRLHVGVVLSYWDQIRAILAEQAISAQDLYDQAGYYVQFTDGTP